MAPSSDVTSATDAGRWEAVLSRDRQHDGRFVFGVRTTGIYCRPSCPARRPRRENVRFFPLPEAAEQAGFRACRRCRPRDVGRVDAAAALVRRACALLQEDRGEPWALAELATELGVSGRHLHRMFKDRLGVSPRQYAEALRMGSLRSRLRKGDPVTQALYEAGFGSSSRLYDGVHARLGMTPGTYRRGGRGQQIRYTVAPCALGHVLLAQTERGIAAVRLGDGAAALERDLREEYTSAAITRDDAGLAERLQGVLALVAGHTPQVDLPLDVRATAFQQRVWRELQAIPPGETRTYGEVARRLGRPEAARAVARACASNPVALLVPCHRVVPAGGSTGGYRWGAARKEALLQGERRQGGRRR
jgi:AraC family transcriptional regulator, regulatory protein of adaptative response / methylated-DNA-[protein]-cysteine methyltransferase